MEKTAAKNKLLFWLVTTAIALLLMITIVPSASAAGEEDTTAPDDVENVEIEVYDGAVMLSWDVATDDTGVEGYFIYSGPDPVTFDSGEYSYDVIDAGDVIEYLVEGLPNEEDIYFAVTAYDAADNESENYSDEVYGTPEPSYGPAPEPEHPAADEEPPTVSDAQAVDMETVKVEFSEAVVLPALNPETAFSIVDNATAEALDVLSVEMDPDDVIGATVLLTTVTHEGMAEYILTAGIQVEDTAGNPIVSGTSDTAAFIGSTIEPGSDLTGDLPEDDFEAPEVVSAQSKGETSMEVVFNEPVILDSDATLNFFIAEEADATSILDILSVELDATGTVATLETGEQVEVDYSLIVTGVLDEAGNEISDLGNTASFAGNVQGEVEDLPDGELVDADLPDMPEDEEEEEVSDIALTPENVQNFVAALVTDLVVKLTWDKPDDPSIIDQILYKSTDGGTNYDAGTSLGADREEVEVTGLSPGTEYYFKLTTKDALGNESDGVITSIMLPETGMGVGLMAGAALGLAALRRRKNKK
ncbi:fibronectin type III domain-containing protein [Patescibacteria group bacterium]